MKIICSLFVLVWLLLWRICSKEENPVKNKATTISERASLHFLDCAGTNHGCQLTPRTELNHTWEMFYLWHRSASLPLGRAPPSWPARAVSMTARCLQCWLQKIRPQIQNFVAVTFLIVHQPFNKRVKNFVHGISHRCASLAALPCASLNFSWTLPSQIWKKEALLSLAPQSNKLCDWSQS